MQSYLGLRRLAERERLLLEACDNKQQEINQLLTVSAELLDICIINPSHKMTITSPSTIIIQPSTSPGPSRNFLRLQTIQLGFENALLPRSLRYACCTPCSPRSMLQPYL